MTGTSRRKVEHEFILPVDLDHDFVSHIVPDLEHNWRMLQRTRPGKPFVFYIQSEGGCTGSAFAFVEFLAAKGIRYVACGMGEVHSAGLILLFGAEKRYAFPSAVFLFHTPSLEGFGGPIDWERSREMHQLLEKDFRRIVRYCAQRTGKPERLFEELMTRRTVLTAKRAKALGLIHKIVASVDEIPECAP